MTCALCLHLVNMYLSFVINEITLMKSVVGPYIKELYC